MLSDEAFNVIEDLVKVKSSPSAGGLKILLGCSFESSATTSAAAKMLKFSDTENKVRKQRRPKTPPHTPQPYHHKKNLLAPVALPRRPNFRTGQGNKLHLVSNVNVQGLHSLPPFAPRHVHDSVCEYDKRQGEILAPPPPLAPCQTLIHEHQPSCDSPPPPLQFWDKDPSVVCDMFQKAFVAIYEPLRKFHGVLRQFLQDDKGQVGIIIFSGRESNTLAACRCALKIKETFNGENLL